MLTAVTGLGSIESTVAKNLPVVSIHQLGLCLSRASASVLNLNCSLILLPMCRILLAFLRGSQKVPSRRTRRLLDKSRTFHITCGVTICIFSGVHVAAHLVNALNFSVNYSEDFVELNAARYRNEDPRKLLFTTVPGLTGVCMVVVLFLMITASTYAIRVSNYDIFWYTHNLFFVFYMLLMLHVSGGLLKYQTNLDTHPPGCINLNRTSSQNISLPEYFSEHFHEPFPEEFSKPEEFTQNTFVKICMEEPRFQANFPQTWLWISGPLCLYCAERLYRYIRSNKPVTIISVISHPSDVMEIRMVKENFKARPGQYIILHCPSVSALENHPFTLTMCPTETKATFGVHLKIVGDWTERFRDLLLPPSSQDSEILPFIQSRNYPKLYIDGPFGSPFEESLNYEISLCVAGGIGVTPFASILNTLLKMSYHSYALLCPFPLLEVVHLHPSFLYILISGMTGNHTSLEDYTLFGYAEISSPSVGLQTYSVCCITSFGKRTDLTMLTSSCTSVKQMGYRYVVDVIVN
nr:NADPH oxidase 4 isoform X3 [Macaca nemestrina]